MGRSREPAGYAGGGRRRQRGSPGLAPARSARLRSRPALVAKGARSMTQTRTLQKLKRAHWRALERLLKQAYQDGFEAGLARAHGLGRRGRTIRADAKVEGLVKR